MDMNVSSTMDDKKDSMEINKREDTNKNKFQASHSLPCTMVSAVLVLEKIEIIFTLISYAE